MFISYVAVGVSFKRLDPGILFCRLLLQPWKIGYIDRMSVDQERPAPQVHGGLTDDWEGSR